MKLSSVAFTTTGYALGFLPIVLGVFVGAPLIAGDLENGTAKLVTSQSVSRVRWIATKLGITVLVVAVGTAVLAGVFGWWWSPAKGGENFASWTSGATFDNTGPVLTALTLFILVGGIAIGMLLRRSLLSMVVTFGFAVAAKIIWSYFRLDLGNVSTVTTNKGVLDSSPTLPDAAYELDRWFTTASGKLYGWSTCVTEPEAKVKGCLDQKGIVGWRVDYLPASEMSSMQWFGASILLALTVALIGFIFVWGRKRIV
jgi:ABC-type transport system involved in multi-copper enzyme maturation permease subunit